MSEVRRKQMLDAVRQQRIKAEGLNSEYWISIWKEIEERLEHSFDVEEMGRDE